MSLAWTTKGTVLTVEMPATCVPYPDREWQDLTAPLLLEASTLYVLDFRRTTSVQRAAYRNLIEFCRVLETNGKQLASLNITANLFREIRTLGLERRFNPAPSLEKAMSKAGIKPSANAVLIGEFARATKTTFETQANTACTPLKSMVVGDAPEGPSTTAIAGVLAVDTTEFKGTIALCFPKAVFLKIYANMLGEEQTEITAEIKDAASELLNIVYGLVKAELGRNNAIHLPPAIPTVITGEGLSVRQATRAPALIIPFQTEAGNFQIEIALDAN